MRARYPHYADAVEVLPEPTGYSFGTTDGVPYCQGRDGEWIHGPGDPRADALTDAEAAIGDSPELIVVARPGVGFLALAVLATVQARTPESVILVVEDRLDLFKAALSHADWSPLFRSSRVVFRLGNAATAIETFIAEHPTVGLLPINVMLPPEIPRLAFQTAAEGVVRRCDQIERTVGIDLERVRARIQQRRHHQEPLKVLLRVPELGYLAEPLARGFQQCGCDVRIEPDSARAELPNESWLSHVSRHAPDIVLWMSRPDVSTFGMHSLRAAGVTLAHWSLDNPARMQLGPDLLDFLDLHACFDGAYLTPGGTRSMQLSLGAGVDPLPGCGTHSPVRPVRRGPPVCFVGSLGEARIAELRRRLAHSNPNRLSVLEELGNGDASPALEFERRTGEPYRGAWCVFVEERRSIRRRTEVLSELAPLGLRVYGGVEWTMTEPDLAACYASDEVPYGFDLSSTYYHSLINVNVMHDQCINSTNSRIYDVLAAGGFLLTEHRPILDEEFVPGLHLETFRTAAEAREKVAYFLAHPEKREEIARAGQAHVAENHSFRIRCRKLLEFLRPRPATSGPTWTVSQ